MATAGTSFKPVLIVVDMQEDFCLPNGSLAVDGGRDIAESINSLLSLPFTLKVATKDDHPAEHVTFTTWHEAPNNKPFVSTALVSNPTDPEEKKEFTIFPVHCVQGTPGNDFIPEIDLSKIDVVVKKGWDKRVEMFSGFGDMFGNRGEGVASIDLEKVLKEKGITHVYTVGLTGDCCVRYTALDAKKFGFETYVLKDVTKCVDSGEKGWGEAVKDFEREGIKVIRSDGEEIKRVRDLKA